MEKATGRVDWDDAAVCRTLRKTYGLDARQARICKTWRPVMQHVSRAAALAAIACQTVLHNRRWNCSSVRAAPRLTPELVKGDGRPPENPFEIRLVWFMIICATQPPIRILTVRRTAAVVLL